MPSACSNPRKFRVTIILGEDYPLDRIWNNLLALDLVIDDVKERAIPKCIMGEWDSRPISILEGVPGVIGVVARPWVEEEVQPGAKIFEFKPSGSFKTLKDSKRRVKALPSSTG